MSYAVKATSESLKDLQPMPDNHATVEVDWRFTPEEFGRIGMGDIPWEFGDRRFSYLENNCLYIHEFLGRSLYVVLFEERGDCFEARQLKINTFGTTKNLNNPDFHKGAVKSYIDGSLIKKNMYMQLEDAQASWDQLCGILKDKRFPLPERPILTNKVYRSEYGDGENGVRNALRVIIKIDRNSELYFECYLNNSDGCQRRKVGFDGRQTDLRAEELDPRLMEG